MPTNTQNGFNIMGKMLVAQITDDLNGNPLSEDAVPTLLFVNGRMVELYLGPDSMAKLDKAVAPFFKAGDVTEGVSVQVRRPNAGTGNVTTNSDFPELSDVDNEEIRAWAQGQTDLTVSDKGRLSNAVKVAYVERVIRQGQPTTGTDTANAA